MDLSLAYADRLLARVCQLLEPVCQRVEVAGSVRRRVEPVHVLEVVVIPLQEEVRLDLFRVDYQPSAAFVAVTDQWIVLQGDARCDNVLQRWLPGMFTLRIHLADPANFGLRLLLATGNFAFREDMKSRWARRRWSIAGGSLHKKKCGTRLPVYEEKDLFALLKMPYVEPHNRTIPLTDEQRDKLAGKPRFKRP